MQFGIFINKECSIFLKIKSANFQMPQYIYIYIYIYYNSVGCH